MKIERSRSIYQSFLTPLCSPTVSKTSDRLSLSLALSRRSPASSLPSRFTFYVSRYDDVAGEAAEASHAAEEQHDGVPRRWRPFRRRDPPAAGSGRIDRGPVPRSAVGRGGDCSEIGRWRRGELVLS